ncbi:MAG: methylmalonyl Co-A mutase-associated GTPase MeaB, partial [Pseudomonadota bacterium]
MSAPSEGILTLEGLKAACLAGKKAVISQALTALEVKAENPSVLALLDEARSNMEGRIVGLTGPPGVGKSSLSKELIAAWRKDGKTVAVIAVDPSSRLSGGALLGDRIRLAGKSDDAGVFIRSMAARKRLGGVADIAFPAATLLAALYDIVLIETVGVGQSEADVAMIADVVVFCVQPAAGDSLQFMKAGVMELPDVFVVTKADLGALANQARAELEGALGLILGRAALPPILSVSARKGIGIKNVIEAISAIDEVPDRRASQLTSWAEDRVTDLFGRVGWDQVSNAFPEGGVWVLRPFSHLANVKNRLYP